MESKRGSHVGFILSFVIFVTFVIFIYSILSPTLKNNTEKESAMKILKQNLMKEMSSNLTTITLDNSEVGYNPVGGAQYTCVKLDLGEVDDLKLDAEFNELEKRFVVDDKLGALRNSFSLSGENLFVGVNGFKIYFSRAFKKATNGAVDTDCADAVYRSKKTSEIFLGDETLPGIVKTINEIDNAEDYALLKNKLKLESKYNFGMRFTDADNNPTKSNNFDNPNVVVNTDIYSEETLINYIDSNANIRYGKLVVKLW